MKTENAIATKNVLAQAGMKVKTNLKAGDYGPGGGTNHNQTVARSLRVKSNIKAGRILVNHNQSVARSMRVKSGMKGGFNPQPEPPGLRIKSGVKAGGILVPE